MVVLYPVQKTIASASIVEPSLSSIVLGPVILAMPSTDSMLALSSSSTKDSETIGFAETKLGAGWNLHFGCSRPSKADLDMACARESSMRWPRSGEKAVTSALTVERRRVQMLIEWEAHHDPSHDDIATPMR